jgi:hypothetical protein
MAEFDAPADGHYLAFYIKACVKIFGSSEMIYECTFKGDLPTCR